MLKKVIGIFVSLAVAFSVFMACEQPKPKPEVAFDVTFVTAGASDVTDAPTVQKVKQDGFAVRPSLDPSSSDKFFDDWYTTAEFTVLFDFSTSPVTRDTIVYAKWLDAVTMTFDANGKSAQSMPETQRFAQGKTATRPENKPTADGFTFVDWCTAAGGADVFDFTTPVTQNTVLYAKWSEVAYIVTFDSNGVEASGMPASVEVGAGGTVSRPSPNPTAVKKTFRSWTTDAAGEKYFSFDYTEITSDLTIYANWTNVYYLDFNANGKTEVVGMPSRQEVNDGYQTTRPADPSLDGMYFGDWYTDADGKTIFDFGTRFKADIVLYAKWLNPVTVTFDKNTDGEVTELPAAQTFGETRKALDPVAPPVLSGKVFGGWYTDAACQTAFDFDKEVLGSKTLYAGWLEPVAVSFDANGQTDATLPPVQTVGKGRTARLQAAYSDTMIFDGWYTDSAATLSYDFSTPVEAPLMLFAKWRSSQNASFSNPAMDFSSFRGGAGVKGIVDAKTVTSAEDITLKWKQKLSAGWSSSGWPIEVGDYLFAAVPTAEGHKLAKIDKETGETLKAVPLSEKIGFFSTIAYGDGKIFVPIGEGKIQAFDADTMDSLWITAAPVYSDGTKVPGLQSLSPITYNNGYVYMGASQGSVTTGVFYCVSTADEDPKNPSEVKDFTWSFAPKNEGKTNGFYWSAGAVVGDYIVFAGEEGVLYSHHLTVDTRDKYNKTVFADSLALTKKDASTLEAVRSSVHFDPYTGRVYTVTKTGRIHSVKVNTDGTFDLGSYKFKDVSSDITSSPTAYRGRLYIGGGGIESTAGIAVLDGETLEIIYTIALNSQSSPVLSTAYATAENNYQVYIYAFKYTSPDALYLIRDAQGQTEADFEKLYDVPDKQYNTSSATVGVDGTIYFKNDSGFVYAVGNTQHAFTAVDVTNAINLLPAVDKYKAFEETAVLRAAYRYDNLSADEKAKVPAAQLEKLTALKALGA